MAAPVLHDPVAVSRYFRIMFIYAYRKNHSAFIQAIHFKIQTLFQGGDGREFMGFFSKWFGLDKDQVVDIQAAIRAEIDIGECVVAHMKWKGRLQSYVEGTSGEMLDPMVICRDDQCALGKWIHGQALTYFHSDRSFHQLRSNHANFHFVAGNVVKKVQENDRRGAEELLTNEYARVSRSVIRDLGELNKHLGNE